MDTHSRMMFCLKMSGMLFHPGGFFIQIYCYYFFCCFFIFGSSLFLYLYLDPKPIMSKLQTMHYSIALIQIFFKFSSVFFNQREVVGILREIELLSRDAETDPGNKPFIDRANKIIKRITRFFLFIFVAYYPLRTTSLFLKHFLLRRPPQLFLEGAYIPHFLVQYYVLGVFYQVFTSLCTGFTNASYSIFIIFVTLHISAQLQVLQKMMEESTELKLCILLHQKLMRLFFRVNKLLSGLMLVEIVLTSFYSCVCSFLIIQSLSTGGKEMGNHFHILILVLIRSFIICYCGNIISKQGEKLHRSAYFGKWYDLGKEFGTNLQFMLFSTSVQPFQYNYRRFMTMNMAQFMKAMQTTYSYLTLLLSLVGNK